MNEKKEAYPVGEVEITEDGYVGVRWLKPAPDEGTPLYVVSPDKSASDVQPMDLTREHIKYFLDAWEMNGVGTAIATVQDSPGTVVTLNAYELRHLLAALTASDKQETCGACAGTGRMVRDPDIGTDQECFVCDGSGKVSA